MGAIKLIHRIRVVFVGKGIERSLPYEIEEEVVATQVSNTLNLMLEGEGYHHYVIPVEEQAPLPPKKGKTGGNAHG
jgi:hypothetical protein